MFECPRVEHAGIFLEFAQHPHFTIDMARAPEAVIAKEREKLEGYAEAKAKLIEQQAVIAAL